MSNLIGQSLGRYHILEQLGEGGMAVVYKAYDTRLESDVAVKVIRTENLPQSGVERALKRFEREAKSLAKLTHPNIVPIIDYGEYEGSPYLVMKYLPGGTLKQRLGQPMPYQEAAQILAPIARALEYAHQHDIVHRDVKPSNILITESGQPMLSDFGVAKILEADETMDLTGTSMGVGTPEYMAPEQVTSKTADARADIYSLGVVLFELVTGRKPFVADTPMAVLFKQASEPLPRPRQFVPGLPEVVEKVLFKALAKKPEDRYQDAGSFAEALVRLGIGEVEGEWGKTIKEAPKSRRMAWLVGGLIGLVVLAVGIGLGIFLMRSGGKTTPVAVATSTSAPAKGESVLPVPTGKLLWSDDFEDGFAHNFTFYDGEWKVVDDGTGNKVLQLNSPSEVSATWAYYGPSNLAEGIFEFRFRVVSTNNEVQAGILDFTFRLQGNNFTHYVLLYDPNGSNLSMVYQENGGTYQPLEGISGGGIIQPQDGGWITLRVEFKGPNIRVFVNGNLFITAEDSRDTAGALTIGAPVVAQFDDFKVWDFGTK